MKKKIIIACSVIFLIVILCISFLMYKNIQEKRIESENKKIVESIKNNYNKYVVTTKKTYLYDKNNKKIGKIGKSVKIELKDKKINDVNDKYFEIKELDGNYIYYKDIKPIESLDEKDNYYKNYLVFNQNIVANKITFYDNNFNLLYQIKGDFNLPIYVKENDYYGVEFNNQLLYVKKDEIEVVDSNNTDLKNAKDVPIILYHFFHDHNRYENMTTVISMRIDKFEEQMKYLSDNDFLTLKMKDLEDYIDGKIQIRENSVVITIDDANESVFSLAQPVIEKYNINATVFAITSWNENYIDLATDNIEIHSHTHNMHITGKCSGGQGGLFKCVDYNTGLEDLKKSSSLLNNTTYLAYPFGEYTDLSIKLLKDAGYTVALTTNYGKAKVGDNKLLLPRIYMYNEYSLNTFKNIVN